MIPRDVFADATACDVCGRETCEDHLPPAPAADGNDAAPTALVQSCGLVGMTVHTLSQHIFPDRKPILVRGDNTVVFRAGHLGEIYAERGVGKTWLVCTLAIIAASKATALGFRALSPSRVLHVDGEMGSRELQDRYLLQAERLGMTLADLPITVVAADWQPNYLPRLDTPMGQALIEPFIEQADVVFLDNRSCLLDPEGEKDAAKWQPAQDWLLSLRRRGKAVMVGHHSNRLGGARGHSKAEDPMNLLIKLTRPEDYRQDQGARFILTFDKSRGAYGEAVAPFGAHLTAEGWQMSAYDEQQQATVEDRLLQYVRLAQAAGEPAKSANEAISKASVNRNAGLAAWAALKQRGLISRDQDGRYVAT